ncbi:23S rRNA (uracil-5-)-methyltransferase RumA [Candidatus Uhrbacteria bacterium RIFCSPHIGHO2_02_FULL_47_44]|uniref:23S rRNA (Uracil-5-)-methyltransferase RumA n=1 Tax=Candidatus Uhrbacteria bacterium RIFCSPLOWO2_02_FULL_48_18 TaxID=1802408 RepID=A0A1F7VCW5_9BACT|nr:MAG: 23S rRNA (uracil-5-)-methyltransferase RumA [Candidatus Uhrbacteria bacterium RIFCSPHIGHO2_01_FULL_47_10]OGL70456.1 MAG: 23S rRNA (uracil-5-)-methyltransferase RumA [Candidatus Uhrbacteria bacterium RIFCSPHIGHO2_02_FULL_47_44]OGL76852.1 MAG: 23S rRNA (uracil-5-)-methyltransferase RumA [Candidatus Uhrbacteria bacterium RIFCSPHIGHO2_12_FULL_47_12]OGL82321.1 MAG: 23S rRNA (uracil-5-)-methyltransferase RumA [Candidatus Uhrbacteria bacterium RIFCSPLOWO2_01_FULL_47_17]OGL87968.1 MAG: 23S rRNA
MSHLCPNKELCGSCAWSHIPYEKQLIQKVSDINGSFKLKGLSLKCEEVLPSPKLEHYRNRMDFVIDFEGRVGMRQKDKWWKVLDNHTCFLADEQIDALFVLVREWAKTCGLSFYDRRAHTGLLRYATIRATRTGQTMIVLVTSAPSNEDERSQILSALSALSALAAPSTLIWSINATDSDTSFGTELTTISGAGYIEEEISSVKYRISPNAFFQTNSYASHLLLDTVKEFCGDVSDKRVLDLYCGTGFFSIALASSAREMIGVELNAEAIEDAKTNAILNNVSPEFFAAPTEDYDWSKHNADIVILDPPRSGMHDRALADVIKHKPITIIYVSCNPKNFAREMVQLQEIYNVTAMKAIDMFPHTPHVELVTKLELK